MMFKNWVDNLISEKIFYAKNTRPMIDFVRLTKKQNDLVGAEIGVAYGSNALNILSVLPNIKKLYLIDPFVDIDKKFAYKKLKPFWHKTVFIKDYSYNAYKVIDEKLDFIYFDGDHEKEGIEKDLEYYYPLVKKDGVIGGHDFCGNWIGLTDAVLTFAKNKRVKLFGNDFDWWFIKNE